MSACYHRAQLFVVAVVWPALLFNSVLGINTGHGKETPNKFDDHVVSYNFIDNYLRESTPSDSSMGDFIWSLLYHDPSASYSPGLAFKKRIGKRLLANKRQQGWHVNYGKRSDRKRNQMWFSGYEKRDTRVSEDSNSENWPAPSLVLHPPWYGRYNKAPYSQFDKRQQGWHTSYGKRQQGWYK